MAYKHVDEDSAGGGDGSTWSLSGGTAAYTISEYATWAAASVAADDTIYVKKATAAYSNAANIILSAKDGTLSAPIKLIGVKEGTTNVGANVVYSDWAIAAADRPNIDIGAFSWFFGQYWYLANFIITGSDAAYTVSFSDIATTAENLDVANTGIGEAISAAGQYSKVINCKVTAQSACGIHLGSYGVAMFCHCDGCATGIIANAIGCVIESNIISDCTTGINLDNDDAFRIINNTIDDCTNGIIGIDAERGVVLNNIISNCTDGWKFNNSGTVITSNIIDYNNWYNNTQDMSWDNGSTEDNSAKGGNATAVNPNYNAAGSDDYSLTSGDCIDGGKSMIRGVG